MPRGDRYTLNELKMYERYQLFVIASNNLIRLHSNNSKSIMINKLIKSGATRRFSINDDIRYHTSRVNDISLSQAQRDKARYKAEFYTLKKRGIHNIEVDMVYVMQDYLFGNFGQGNKTRMVTVRRKANGTLKVFRLTSQNGTNRMMVKGRPPFKAVTYKVMYGHYRNVFGEYFYPDTLIPTGRRLV